MPHTNSEAVACTNTNMNKHIRHAHTLVALLSPVRSPPHTVHQHFTQCARKARSTLLHISVLER